MSEMADQDHNHNLSETDAILLSAYLDGELSAEERATLEVRLSREPALNQELEAMRSGGELLRQVDAMHTPQLADPAACLTTVRHQLRAACPDEGLPVAPALRPSRIRRLSIVALAGVFLVLLLGLVISLLQRMGLPTPCGWDARPLGGTVAIERRDRIVLALDREILLVGDRLHLDQKEEALLSGPSGLRLRVTGPAILRCDGHAAIFVEQGHVEVEGQAFSASALHLTTPDGRIRPEDKDAFDFVVDVKEKRAVAP